MLYHTTTITASDTSMLLWICKRRSCQVEWWVTEIVPDRWTTQCPCHHTPLKYYFQPVKRAGRDDAATAEGCQCLHMTFFAHDLDLNTYSMLKYTLLIELQPTKVKDLCKWHQQKHEKVMMRVMLQTCTSILNRDKNGDTSWKLAMSRSFLGFPLPPTCHCLTTAKIPFPHTQSGRHSTSFKAKISTIRQTTNCTHSLLCTPFMAGNHHLWQFYLSKTTITIWELTNNGKFCRCWWAAAIISYPYTYKDTPSLCKLHQPNEKNVNKVTLTNNTTMWQKDRERSQNRK